MGVNTAIPVPKTPRMYRISGAHILCENGDSSDTNHGSRPFRKDYLLLQEISGEHSKYTRMHSLTTPQGTKLVWQSHRNSIPCYLHLSLDWKPLTRCKRKDCNVGRSKDIMLASAISPGIRTSRTILRRCTLTSQSQQALQQITISADLLKCEHTFCTPSTAVSVPTRLSAEYLRSDKTSIWRSLPVKTSSGSLWG